MKQILIFQIFIVLLSFNSFLLGQENNPPSDIIISQTAINEGVPINTEVASFAAVDADVSDFHTFMLVMGDGVNDADNGKFSIIGNHLFTDTIIDYESQQAYNIYVKCSDLKDAVFEKSFHILRMYIILGV